MTNDGALGGVRVLDLAGPFGSFGARMLADLGADVIRVEPPGGDPMRRRGPFARENPHIEGSLPFFLLNCNKRGVTLDLESSVGRHIFSRLARQADVVIESAAPGQLDRAGIGYRALQRTNPRLVWASVTPFGQEGPWAHFQLSDIGAQAVGGALYLTGDEAQRPVRAGGRVAEKMTGYMAALAIVMALRWRENGGTGQFIDVSALEAVASQMESFTTKIIYTGDVYTRQGRLYPRTYPAGIFPAGDGWVSLVAGPVHQWHSLRDWVDDDRLRDPAYDDLDARMKHRPYLDDILCAWTSRYGQEHLFHEGQRRRIPVGVALTPGGVTRDPHLRERSYLAPIQHAHLGEVEVPGCPYLLEKSPWSLRRPAPQVGEHNLEVFGEVGLDRDTVDHLYRLGVL